MAIPDYQTLMLPVLRLAGDGLEHTQVEVLDRLADQFNLTTAERAELIPSGQQTLFSNRTQWARSYLKAAGLLASTGRARFKITQRGLDVLAENPDRIDNAFLRRFPEFVQFVLGGKKRERVPTNTGGEVVVRPVRPDGPASDAVGTPEEQLDANYAQLRTALAQELLERISQRSPAFFERLVVDLLVAMGYGGSRLDAGEALGRSGDGGIDGIIKEDRLGLDAIYLQAKRWSSSVGRPVVQQFAGSLMGRKARKGVLITTSEFTTEAAEYADSIDLKIVLIDGRQLADLMVDHGVGVKEVVTYRVFKADADYFTDE